MACNVLYPSASIPQKRCSSLQIMIADPPPRVVGPTLAEPARAASYQVWARALWAPLALADLAGLCSDRVFMDLPFDAVSVRARRSIDWDDFCVACERLEELCGGPEACQHLLATSYHLVLPELRSFAGLLARPATFARLMIEGVSPLIYQGCAFSLEELERDRIRVSLRLRPGARPSLTFFRATIGELRALPRHIGLPPAIVSADVGPEHGNYDVLLPPSQSLATRTLRVARQGVRFVLGLAPDGAEIALTFGETTNTDPCWRLHAAAEAWQLTTRQREILASVVDGSSNKEVALALACAENTVELHVTQILKKAGVTSRARLIAHYWSRL
jgi:DNA-binding CsgD family transcriptional regulator